MEFVVILVVIIVVAVIIKELIPLPQCDICDAEIGKKAQIHYWQIEGTRKKLCSKCNRKLENQEHKKKFDNFFSDQKNSDLPEINNRRISKQTKVEVWRRDKGMCVECGSNENLEFDHVIPVSRGGSNTTRNIQLLCERCNRRKSAKIQ